MRNVYEREFDGGYFGAHNVERILTDIDADYGNRSLLSQAWRAPCPDVPGQLIAGGAGARPDHPILMSPVKHAAHGFPSPRGLIVKFLH
jgi:hypothetical protein